MELAELLKHVVDMSKQGEKVSSSYLTSIDSKGLIKRHFGDCDTFFASLGIDAEKHLSPLRRMSGICSSCGIMFEELLGELLKEVGLKWCSKPIGNLKPDFVVGDKFIDAKLSKSVAENGEASEKYEPYCEKLILVYLCGESSDYMISDKTRIVRYDSFYELLPDITRKSYYEPKFKRIKRIAELAQKEREIISSKTEAKSNE